MMQSHPRYRADIDGLRAIAILAVVLYHIFPQALPGGFIGVDIFFVISGYLISTIIFENLERGDFSLRLFYCRRVKRIFPALIFVLGTSLCLGWFLLLTAEYKELARHALASSLFTANIALWQESGYFNHEAETKPLLHLWSLGIEEQFYFVWPLLVCFIHKKRKQWLPFMLAAACAGSFLLNIEGVRKDPTGMFYLPHARAWELLVGAGVAYITVYAAHFVRLRAWLMPVQAWLGALLIVSGLVFITPETHFPGWAALLPVLGAALIIAAPGHNFLAQKILSHRWLVGIGLISYPLYLWHWPLLTFTRIMSGGAASVPAQMAAITLAFLLAWATYRFVEKPIRRNPRQGKYALVLAGMMVLIAIAAAALYKFDGVAWRSYPQRFSSYTETITLSARKDECFEIPYAYKKTGDWFCTLGPATMFPRLFVYGDSHALSYLPAFEKLAKDHAYAIAFSGASGCPPLLGVQSLRGAFWTEQHNCLKVNQRIFDYVKENHIPAVLLVGRWSYYMGGTTRPEDFNPLAPEHATQEATHATSKQALGDGLANAINAYRAIGVHVYVLQDNPQQLDGPWKVLRKAREASDDAINLSSLSREEHRRNQAEANAVLQQQTHQKAKLIDLDQAFCTGKSCPLVQDGKFLYYDADHLSVAGALYVYPELKSALRAVSQMHD